MRYARRAVPDYLVFLKEELLYPFLGRFLRKSRGGAGRGQPEKTYYQARQKMGVQGPGDPDREN